MKPVSFPLVSLAAVWSLCGSGFTPGPQSFLQEVSHQCDRSCGLPQAPVQVLDILRGEPAVFARGSWFRLSSNQWHHLPGGDSPDGEFSFQTAGGEWLRTPLPWREVTQVVRSADLVIVASHTRLFRARGSSVEEMPWPSAARIRQVALASDGTVSVASDRGLYQQSAGAWKLQPVQDVHGRNWAAGPVLGVAFDREDRLWLATSAGVVRVNKDGPQCYEPRDGLPWNGFTAIATGPRGEVWFGTDLGAVRLEQQEWHYRQGPRWLSSDDVRQVLVDPGGRAWFLTAAGISCIERRAMTLGAKAEHYEQEIERYVKRTPFGYVSEAALRRAGDRSSADPQDSDNDGLWTAMYGAGECFAFAATRDAKFKDRAKKAFEALRFLQTVTHGSSAEPPPGFVARTIRPIEWPDPNLGRLAHDREEQKRDRLWKVYEPRWPRSADGKWYWKSDTSSDELDGHFFLYPLYFEFCADTDSEKDRVRTVVKALADHLLDHGFNLVDHDGKPTRWGVYAPEQLNRNPDWWQERGLKSLSILSYLAGAAFVTGDDKYTRASRDLIDRHGYAQNAMHPKVQHGPGSGNQSDDEMAFMCFYNLLRYSKDAELTAMAHVSFYRYWVNEQPEMNPFFNFAYAAHSLTAKGETPWGEFPLTPWDGWHSDSMTTLYGFPLDRLNWPHRNSHRLDIIQLPAVKASDITEPGAQRHRGLRVKGKVLPVENRHFGHWNTDPWRLDYGGAGDELAAGTVFLLPYYMGLYHGFLDKNQ